MPRQLFAPLFVICAAILLAPRPVHATVVTMSWSPVGNPGNAPDPLTGNGEVDYAFNIGTYDVTVGQYVAFLNSNDPTGADPLSLYNPFMSNVTFGGVNFNAAPPVGQMYSVVLGNGNHPINYASWFDAARFANWMVNGQPVYTSEPTADDNATENGAYTLLGF